MENVKNDNCLRTKWTLFLYGFTFGSFIYFFVYFSELFLFRKLLIYQLWNWSIMSHVHWNLYFYDDTCRIVTLRPHSLIRMRPLMFLLKVVAIYNRQPNQGEGHTIQGHCLLYNPVLLQSTMFSGMQSTKRHIITATCTWSLRPVDFQGTKLIY